MYIYDAMCFHLIGTSSTWKMPCSMTKNIVSLVETSNVGEEGVWLFRIDQDTIEPACRDRGQHRLFYNTNPK